MSISCFNTFHHSTFIKTNKVVIPAAPTIVNPNFVESPYILGTALQIVPGSYYSTAFQTNTTCPGWSISYNGKYGWGIQYYYSTSDPERKYVPNCNSMYVSIANAATSIFTQTLNFTTAGTFTCSLYAAPRTTHYSQNHKISMKVNNLTVISPTSLTRDSSFVKLSGTITILSAGNYDLVISCENPVSQAVDSSFSFTKIEIVLV
jgi:hypothetical protein